MSLGFCLLNTAFVMGRGEVLEGEGVGGSFVSPPTQNRPYGYCKCTFTSSDLLLVFIAKCFVWEAGEMAATHVNVAPTSERYRSYVRTQRVFQSFGRHFELEGKQWSVLPWKVFQRAVACSL